MKLLGQFSTSLYPKQFHKKHKKHETLQANKNDKIRIKNIWEEKSHLFAYLRFCAFAWLRLCAFGAFGACKIFS